MISIHEFISSILPLFYLVSTIANGAPNARKARAAGIRINAELRCGEILKKRDKVRGNGINQHRKSAKVR